MFGISLVYSLSQALAFWIKYRSDTFSRGEKSCHCMLEFSHIHQIPKYYLFTFKNINSVVSKWCLRSVHLIRKTKKVQCNFYVGWKIANKICGVISSFSWFLGKFENRLKVYSQESYNNIFIIGLLKVRRIVEHKEHN